jgi:hypothetical protein
VYNVGGEALDLLVQERLAGLQEGFEGSEEFEADGKRVLRVVQGGLPSYRLPLALYHDCVFQGVFEPSPPLLAFYDKYMRRWVETVSREFEVGDGKMSTLWEMVQSSREIARHSDILRAYRLGLQAGDVTILGAVTEGGQGLATGENGRFLAYLEGTPEAQNLLAKNEGLEPYATGALQISDWGEGGVRRIIRREQVAPAKYLTEEFQRRGIPELIAHWVPYEKGDPEGNRWARINNCYIDWSETSVEWLYEHSGRSDARMPVVRNPQLYFREGFCWNVRLTELLKARLMKPSVAGHKAMFVESALPLVPNSTMLACLNSRLLSWIIREFIRSPQSFEMNDARAVPLVIPDELLAGSAADRVGAAVAVQEQCLPIWTTAKLAGESPQADPEYQRLGWELEKIEEEIDGLVAEVYGLPVPEDPVDELVRLAEAEGA